MKKFVLFLVLGLFFIGCINPPQPLETPEEKAVNLADKVPEIDITSRMIESMNNSDACTVDVFIRNYTKLSEANGMDFPAPTQEEKILMQEAITETKQWVKDCNPRLSKNAVKDSETVFFVNYKFELNSNSSCGSTASQEVKVKVDLEKKEAVVQGSNAMDKLTEQQLEQVLEIMGPCAGIMFFSATISPEY